MKKLIVISVTLSITLNFVGHGKNNGSSAGGNSTTYGNANSTFTTEESKTNSTDPESSASTEASNPENNILPESGYILNCDEEIYTLDSGAKCFGTEYDFGGEFTLGYLYQSSNEACTVDAMALTLTPNSIIELDEIYKNTNFATLGLKKELFVENDGKWLYDDTASAALADTVSSFTLLQLWTTTMIAQYINNDGMSAEDAAVKVGEKLPAIEAALGISADVGTPDDER